MCARKLGRVKEAIKMMRDVFVSFVFNIQLYYSLGADLG